MFVIVFEFSCPTGILLNFVFLWVRGVIDIDIIFVPEYLLESFVNDLKFRVMAHHGEFCN